MQTYHNVEKCTDNKPETLGNEDHQQRGYEEHGQSFILHWLACHVVDDDCEYSTWEHLETLLKQHDLSTNFKHLPKLECLRELPTCSTFLTSTIYWSAPLPIWTFHWGLQLFNFNILFLSCNLLNLQVRMVSIMVDIMWCIRIEKRRL